MSIYFAKNFKFSEIACPCCGKDRPLDSHFIYLLQNLRDKIDQPIHISKGGGLRCEIYNKMIGGYYNSAHLYKPPSNLACKASDIYVIGMDIILLAIQAKEIGFSRMGIYPDKGYIHIDTFRPVPSEAWVKYRGKDYIYFRKFEDAIIFIKEKI